MLESLVIGPSVIELNGFLRKSVFDVLIVGGKGREAAEQASGVCLDEPPKRALGPGYADVDL